MKAKLKRHLFTQMSVDSGSLGSLGTVIHPFRESGEYQISILWNNESIRTFSLLVDERYENSQVNIDLYALQRKAPSGSFTLKTGGHAVFYLTNGTDGYAVVATRQPEQKPSDTTPSTGRRQSAKTPTRPEFDSRELREGDLFAVNLLRPGTYSVVTGAKRPNGEITVAYPKPRGRFDLAPDAVSVEVNEKSFQPVRIEIQAMQGIVFRIHTNSRIRLELTKPNDGPETSQPPRRGTWRKPSVTPKTKIT
jgi:hypothetical protein